MPIPANYLDWAPIDRLKGHFAILESAGLSDLGTLKPLQVPTSDYLVSPGIIANSLENDGQYAYQNVQGFQNHTFAAISGFALALRMNSSAVQTVAIDRSYIAAERLSFDNDTKLIISKNVKWLVLIAHELTFGQNVTITWEQPSQAVPLFSQDQGWDLPKPAKAPTDFEFGQQGANGSPGQNGQDGVRGDFAPLVELWCMTMTGRPAFILQGQKGGDGGRGQNGGPGGDGGDGTDATFGFLGAMTRGRGGGGRGGDGGPGGNGGRGGDGGAGGLVVVMPLRLYLLPSTQA